MIRKTIASILCIALFAGIAYATAGYTTSCGKRFMAPDQSYFQTTKEWEDFLRDMNEDLCGTREISSVTYDFQGHYEIYQ